jgi:hypothetical protein
MHMPSVTADALKPVIEAMVEKSAHRMTDSASALPAHLWDTSRAK